MKKAYTAPELEVELFDTVVMDLIVGSESNADGSAKGPFEGEDEFDLGL